MNTYTFFPIPSEHHHSIKLINYTIYLNNIYICSFAYSIIISYTILGKQLYIYDINGQKICTITFSSTLKGLSYVFSQHSVHIQL